MNSMTTSRHTESADDPARWTAVLDRVVLGNQLSPASIAGMVAIVAGLAMVFKHPRCQPNGLMARPNRASDPAADQR